MGTAFVRGMSNQSLSHVFKMVKLVLGMSGQKLVPGTAIRWDVGQELVHWAAVCTRDVGPSLQWQGDCSDKQHNSYLDHLNTVFSIFIHLRSLIQSPSC